MQISIGEPALTKRAETVEKPFLAKPVKLGDTVIGFIQQKPMLGEDGAAVASLEPIYKAYTAKTSSFYPFADEETAAKFLANRYVLHEQKNAEKAAAAAAQPPKHPEMVAADETGAIDPQEPSGSAADLIKKGMGL